MSRKTAISPANIAFIKFWGKKNPSLNLPFNNSISMNLDHCLTTTTVEFSIDLKKDEIFIDGKKASGSAYERVVSFLDIIRSWAKIDQKAKVVSQNNFPADAGIASSASAFSALALAGSKASSLNLSARKLSVLARLGSGSACRSIVDGFAEWKKGKTNDDSYSVQMAPVSYWNLADIVVVVSSEKKKKSSTEGHEAALSSPYFKIRQKILSQRINQMKKALKHKNFVLFGQLLEEEALDLHLIAMTSKPPIFYLDKGTFAVIEKLLEWREEGLRGYFTMDAGPNVHVICQKKDVGKLNTRLKKIPGVKLTIVNYPGIGTRITNKHLF